MSATSPRISCEALGFLPAIRFSTRQAGVAADPTTGPAGSRVAAAGAPSAPDRPTRVRTAIFEGTLMRRPSFEWRHGTVVAVLEGRAQVGEGRGHADRAAFGRRLSERATNGRPKKRARVYPRALCLEFSVRRLPARPATTATAATTTTAAATAAT